MDKLQPLIKHRYWILFSLAVIFVIVGWWVASGAIAADTEARKKSVTDSFSKAKTGQSDPNANWVAAAAEKNAADEKAKLNAATMLWERQQAARSWPPALESVMKGIPFQGEVKEVQTRRKWNREYRNQIEGLIEIVQPYEKGEGLVVVSINSIDHKPFNKWRYQPPISSEIWYCQEDIWLLRSLLTSIARVNEGATRITEAHVRRINRLSLRGGDPEAKPSAGASGGGGFGGGGFGDSAMLSSEGSGGGGFKGMGAFADSDMGSPSGGVAANYPGKEFEGDAGSDILAEEFGASASTASIGGDFGGGGMKGGGMFAPTESAGTGAATDAEEDRYVDEKEGQYKTRGFLLDVIVRDDQLPNLLASLTNSDFPVEIRRVEIVAGVSASSASAGGSMSSSGMGMAGDSMAMGMGMGMGMDDGAMSSDSMSSGLGMGLGSSGMSGKGMMAPGMESGMSSGMPGGMSGGYGAPSAASDPLAVAMADPLLVTVKIGGLMTLYQSLAESNAEEEAEKAAVTEQATTVTPEPEDLEAEQGKMEEGTPDDGAMSDNPLDTTGSPAESGTPGADGTVEPEAVIPAEGEAPMEGSNEEMPDGEPVPAESGGEPGVPAEGSESEPSGVE